MIEIKNLRLIQGNFILNIRHLVINTGIYFVLLGPTGSGKTTLLEAICGLRRLNTGEIYLDTYRITHLTPETRQIGLVYHDAVLFPHMSVFDNISFGLKLRGIKYMMIKEKVNNVCEMFNILHLKARLPQTLSAGERQRVALARAIVLEPKILLLDEPMSALDPPVKRDMHVLLKGIHERFNITVLHVTHNFREALHLAQQIGIIYNGEIIQTGTPEEIFKKPKTKVVAEFVGVENLFQGKIRYRENTKLVDIQTVELEVITDKEGDVYVSIRPEDVFISSEPLTEGTKNVYKGRVIEILRSGLLSHVKIDIGITITALITSASFEHLEIESGKDVWITFKPSAIHVF
jgi:molybdopterin-binding protein